MGRRRKTINENEYGPNHFSAQSLLELLAEVYQMAGSYKKSVFILKNLLEENDVVIGMMSATLNNINIVPRILCIRG